MSGASIALGTGFGAVTLGVQNLFDKFYIDYYSDTVRPNDNAHFFLGSRAQFHRRLGLPVLGRTAGS